jgi:outer membrane protein OmpA-like peptidoglycan-associated protein
VTLAGPTAAQASSTPSPSTQSPASATGGATDIPVAGTFRYSAQQAADNPDIVGVVHAVRRVPGGTAVYFSVGSTQADGSVWIGSQPNAGLGRYGPYDLWSVAVVDTANLEYYTPMQAGGKCLCSQTTDLQSSGKSGVLLTGYALLPPLPADVTTVGVNFGYGAQVEDVPVGDGPLLPRATGGSSVSVLGTGWPALPQESVISSVGDPASYVLPLTRRSADIERAVTTKESPDQIEVDLAADVLFAVDKATLSPAANAKLRDVAAEITRRGTGAVRIVGHTDSTGGTSHNASLSRARAAAVLKALGPMVSKSGISFTSSGKGETQPVADNSTKEGRRLNRRVTITFEVAK